MWYAVLDMAYCELRHEVTARLTRWKRQENSGVFRTFAVNMGRKAIILDEQIKLLSERGMIISNVEKAKEVLYDVG